MNEETCHDRRRRLPSPSSAHPHPAPLPPSSSQSLYRLRYTQSVQTPRVSISQHRWYPVRRIEAHYLYPPFHTHSTRKTRTSYSAPAPSSPLPTHPANKATSSSALLIVAWTALLSYNHTGPQVVSYISLHPVSYYVPRPASSRRQSSVVVVRGHVSMISGVSGQYN